MFKSCSSRCTASAGSPPICHAIASRICAHQAENMSSVHLVHQHASIQKTVAEIASSWSTSTSLMSKKKRSEVCGVYPAICATHIYTVCGVDPVSLMPPQILASISPVLGSCFVAVLIFRLLQTFNVFMIFDPSAPFCSSRFFLLAQPFKVDSFVYSKILSAA